jgi:lipopolysaccharide exporter
VTIPLALILRSYWALLIGSLAGSCVAVALSYLFHDYRPRLSLAALRELLNFSKWILLTSIVEFVYGQMAKLIIGRWSGPATVGVYTIAGDVAAMATQEVAAPVHRAVFPAYAKFSRDRVQLRRSFLKVTGLLLLIVLPSGVGISLLAEPVVTVLLGARWSEAVPLIQVLGINSILAVLLSSTHYVSLVVGMARASSLVLAVHCLITIPLMLWSVPRYVAMGAVLSILLASVVTARVNFYLVGRTIVFGWRAGDDRRCAGAAQSLADPHERLGALAVRADRIDDRRNGVWFDGVCALARSRRSRQRRGLGTGSDGRARRRSPCEGPPGLAAPAGPQTA